MQRLAFEGKERKEASGEREKKRRAESKKKKREKGEGEELGVIRGLFFVVFFLSFGIFLLLPRFFFIL